MPPSVIACPLWRANNTNNTLKISKEMLTATRPEMAYGTIVLGILPSHVKCWQDDGKLRPMLILSMNGSDAEIVPLSTNCRLGIHLVPNENNHLTRPCVVMGDTRLTFTDADRLPVIGELTAGERVKLHKVLGWYPVRWRHTV